MAEITQREPLSAQGVKELAPSSGLGAVLRSEREKKGLGLDQVAAITKLRVRVVEALENEKWGDLPPPVFVRGFIRSYASVLGLDGNELLHLYERVAPPQSVTGESAGVRQRSNRGLLLLAVISVLILGFIAYLLVERRSPPGEQHIQAKQGVLESGKEKRDEGPPADKVREGGGDQGPSPAQEMAALPAAVPPQEAEREPAAAEPAEFQTTTPASSTETQAEIISPDNYELKGVVLEETWVRVQIDNGGPKEYIFKPGARPQWKAMEGFQVTVGNAAGIEFELNGTKVKSLGKPGKVVKLNLPASFKPTRMED